MHPAPHRCGIGSPTDRNPDPRATCSFRSPGWPCRASAACSPIVQREMVEKKRWLTPEEFLEDWAVAQVLPGPNVINLALMIGDRYFGLRGAVAAVAGMLTVPLVVILALAVLYAHFAGNPQVAGALARHGRGGRRPDRRHRHQADPGAAQASARLRRLPGLRGAGVRRDRLRAHSARLGAAGRRRRGLRAGPGEGSRHDHRDALAATGWRSSAST